MIHEILVPCNDDSESRRVTEVGAGCASALNVQLRVLVYSDDPNKPVHWKSLQQFLTAIQKRYKITPQIAWRPQLDSLSAELLAQSALRSGSVLCIPSSGPNRRGVVGHPLSTEILSHKHAPTVLVGPRCPGSPFGSDGPMLVALDGSSASEEILAVAHEWAEALGIDVVIANVQESKHSAEAIQAIEAGDVLESAYVSAVARYSAVAADSPSFEVLHGDPASEILRLAASSKASIIAMSSHVPHGLDRLIHGSVLDLVSRRSPIPILALAQTVSAPHGDE